MINAISCIVIVNITKWSSLFPAFYSIIHNCVIVSSYVPMTSHTKITNDIQQLKFLCVFFQHLGFTWLHNNLDHPSFSTCLVSFGSPREEIIYSPWDFGRPNKHHAKNTQVVSPKHHRSPPLRWSLGPFFLRRQRIKHSTGRCSGRHDSPGAWRGGVTDLPRLVATAMCAKRDGQAMRSGSAATGKGAWDVVLGDIL